MKKVSVLACTLGLTLSLQALAVEHKNIADVNVAALTAETQKMSNNNGVHLVWWIPPEYWEASVTSSANVAEKERDAIIKALRGYSMLAVTQAEVAPLGNIVFYERDLIVKGMKIELADGKNITTLTPVEKVPDDLQMLLKMLAPVLQSALGKLGENLQFFVLDDEIKGERLVSPYGNAALKVALTNKSGTVLEPFVFQMPLDALFVPRMCPGGKPAHVSWVVCPWDGTALPK
jgi:hypothetical protein